MGLSLGFSSSPTAEEVTEGIDASNLTVVITGANTGVGAETARVLAKRGAEVVIAVRRVPSGEKVKESILKETSNARIHVLHLDLSSMASVRKFATDFKALELPLNVLINNAGILWAPYQLSADGIELQFATNHIGHFLLTKLLLDNMKKTAQASGIEGRIVNLSSEAHKITFLKGAYFDKINDESRYHPFYAYGESKLANVLHVKELTKKLQQEGINITANAVHPGLIRTQLQDNISFIGWFEKLTYLFWKTVPQGAATQCFLALHPSVKGVSGKYFSGCKESRPNYHAENSKLAKTLWDLSEKLIAEK